MDSHWNGDYPAILISVISLLKLYLSTCFCKVVSWTPDTLFGTNCYFLLRTHSAFPALRNSFEMNKRSICWKGKWIVHMNDMMVVNLPLDINIKSGNLFAWETLSEGNFPHLWKEFFTQNVMAKSVKPNVFSLLSHFRSYTRENFVSGSKEVI